MLRAAFRNRHLKGSDQGNSNESSESEDEFHEAAFSAKFSKKSAELEHGEVNILSDKSPEDSFFGAKDGEKSSDEDFNENLLSKASDATTSKETSSKMKSSCDQGDKDEELFPYSERQIYEIQLLQLQEQLVATMISEQEKDEQLKKYQEVDIEKLQQSLKEEQEKNADLAEKLKVIKNKMQNSKLSRANASKSDPRRKSNRSSKNLDDIFQGDEWIDVSAELCMNTESNSIAQDKSEHPMPSSPSDSRPPLVEEADRTSSSEPQVLWAQSMKDKPDGTSRPTARNLVVQDYKKRAIEVIVERLWDFVNDEPDSTPEDNGEDDSLSVKKLKENINRFTKGIKPITNFVTSVHMLVDWSNIAASCLAFIIYMYAARHGYLFSILLLLVIWKLFLNYLSARGLAVQIGLETKEKEEVNDDRSLSDKFQLVLEVAKKVQNTLGNMADSLEKIKNLLMWQHPATRKLFVNICLLFAASLLLSGPTLFMFMALGFGIKIFITGALYAKFPKVKKRYDAVAQVWKELPTDAELATRDEMARVESESITTVNYNATDASTLRATRPSGSNPPSQSWMNFCEKMKLPSTENPLPYEEQSLEDGSCGSKFELPCHVTFDCHVCAQRLVKKIGSVIAWEDGHRCTLMNKDKPLTNMKHGRLYLTQNYLCFERSRSGSCKNIAIKLENIKSVSKYKPIHIMPGSGMSIEVEVKGISKPYIFGALLGRDELFESLMMTGRAANYRWSC